eukprot:TRINITY_DN3079_c0_g2_i4.p1 TRINITY_DN3079_c0_g2~~TRINITY_DN3079_c0_g2_i4.p1  ORF type:complete len:380 (-),score=115.17 TRINITY_DN3079_c0_g2_i4:166-1305(-)
MIKWKDENWTFNTFFKTLSDQIMKQCDLEEIDKFNVNKIKSILNLLLNSLEEENSLNSNAKKIFFEFVDEENIASIYLIINASKRIRKTSPLHLILQQQQIIQFLNTYDGKQGTYRKTHSFDESQLPVQLNEKSGRLVKMMDSEEWRWLKNVNRVNMYILKNEEREFYHSIKITVKVLSDVKSTAEFFSFAEYSSYYDPNITRATRSVVAENSCQVLALQKSPWPLSKRQLSFSDTIVANLEEGQIILLRDHWETEVKKGRSKVSFKPSGMRFAKDKMDSRRTIVTILQRTSQGSSYPNWALNATRSNLLQKFAAIANDCESPSRSTILSSIKSETSPLPSPLPSPNSTPRQSRFGKSFSFGFSKLHSGESNNTAIESS